MGLSHLLRIALQEGNSLAFLITSQRYKHLSAINSGKGCDRMLSGSSEEQRKEWARMSLEREQGRLQRG